MYEQVLTVTPSEASCNNELKLRALLNHLQDVAGNAVSGLEGTHTQMLARGYAWILMKYELELMRRLPMMDDSYRVRTWHCATESYNTLRIFEGETLTGEPLFWGKTSWLLLDLAAGRPVKAAAHLPELFVAAGTPIAPDFREIPEVVMPAQETLFPVRFHDLDPNGHVNNAVYFEWAFEGTPLDLMTHGLRECSALFRTSARYGDSVRVLASELPRRDSVREFAYEMWSSNNVSAKPAKPLACFSAVWERLAS